MPGARQRRSMEEQTNASDGTPGNQSTQSNSSPVLRRPRHGGWKSATRRENTLLRGESGYPLGMFRILYGVLLVQRTLTFMRSGAIDASFPSEDGKSAMMTFTFGIFGNLGGPPEAPTVRVLCWLLCATGAALSVGFRSNGVAMAASLTQFYILLLDKALYTDEAYLFALTALVLSMTDCGLALGINSEVERARLGWGGGRVVVEDSKSRQPPDTVPHWHTVLLKFQMCIVYIHRGLAKASIMDWLLGGQPLLHTLQTMPKGHLIPRAALWAAQNVPGFGGGGLEALAIRLSSTSIFLDLFLGVSLLAMPDYRSVALLLHGFYHTGATLFLRPEDRVWHLLFLSFLALYLDPKLLTGVIQRLTALLQPEVRGGAAARARRQGRHQRLQREGREKQGPRQEEAGAETGGRDFFTGGGGKASERQQERKLPLQPMPHPAMVALLVLYVCVQALLPLRHLLTALPVEWGRQGHTFAWRGGDGRMLVREEALVRIMHRARTNRKGAGAGRAPEMNTVHLYQAPFTAQQVNRMVVDPGMLLQVVKASSTTPPPPGSTKHRREGPGEAPPPPPHSYVDAWKSVNGRPFMQWTNPTVDLWGKEGQGGGAGVALERWLLPPIRNWELHEAAAAAELVRSTWASTGKHLTFFAGRQGQALSNIFLGGYDPTNLNTTELCSVVPSAAPGGQTGGGGGHKEEGILLGVALGEVEVLTPPAPGQAMPGDGPVVRRIKAGEGAGLAPMGMGHTVRAAGGPGGITLWYYVHKCPEGIFHLCIGYLSTGGWNTLYHTATRVRKGWVLPQQT